MRKYLFVSLIFWVSKALNAQELYLAPKPHENTRWISPENPSGAKGEGGKANQGAKGSAFFTLKSGEKLILMDVKGAGIINRMWLSGTIPRSEIQRTMVKIDIYWDNDPKPAVSTPIGDFFGCALGLSVPFESALFSNPEGRSFNFVIPMPFRKAAKIVLTNDSPTHALVWYDINYTELEALPEDALYFHAFWNRQPKTKIGVDFEILPQVLGKGRYLGTNIGIIGDSTYRNTWFGEGEVKIFLDGDKNLPTLVGTGTEDYIGSGWGQGEYINKFQGSLVSDTKNDLYAFYRYHIPDPVFFHRDCRVTIQQIGNTSLENLIKISNLGLAKPIWVFKQGESSDVLDLHGTPPEQILLLDHPELGGISKNDSFKKNFGSNFYRSDDVSATAYFFLNKTSSNLPNLPPAKIRIEGLKENVWLKHKPKP